MPDKMSQEKIQLLRAYGTRIVITPTAEIYLLKHMMEAGHSHEPDETIEPIIQPVEHTFSSRANLEDALPNFYETPVILVIEEDRPVGILTKIDVLDFIARKI